MFEALSICLVERFQLLRAYPLIQAARPLSSRLSRGAGKWESAGRQKEEVCPEKEGIEVSFSVFLNRIPW